MTDPHSAQQREIQALAREFAHKEIRPLSADWDSRRCLDEEMFEKLGGLGFMGLRIPEAYGGLGLDVVTYLLALEELAWGDASLALSVAVHNGPVAFLLDRCGTEEQKADLLPRMASGEMLGALAFSEPEAGSDARSLTTRAVREADGWRLDGEKKWVTNGGRAGLTVLFARTGEAPSGLGAFLLARDADGVRVGEEELTMGLRASQTVGLRLSGVRVPDSRVLGDAGAAHGYAMEAVDIGRVGVAALAVGISRAALEHARAYAEGRVQFGRPLSGFQATRFKLAEMATSIEMARSLTHSAGVALDKRFAYGSARGAGGASVPADPGWPTARALAAMAKLTASQASSWITDEAVQIFGGYGYMRDYPVERLLRDAMGTEMLGGTTEIMRLAIARELLGETPAGET